MTLDQSGNVGIGTVAPVNKLHVVGSVATITPFGATLTNVNLWSTNSAIAESDGSYNQANVKANGNARFLKIGINPTTAGESTQAFLHIGKISISLDINAPGFNNGSGFIGNLTVHLQGDGSNYYMTEVLSGEHQPGYWPFRAPAKTAGNDVLFWYNDTAVDGVDYIYVFFPFDKYRSSSEPGPWMRANANVQVGCDSDSAIVSLDVVNGSIGTVTNQTWATGTTRVDNTITAGSTSAQNFGSVTNTFAGDVLPSADNSKDLGSSSYRWANIYTTDLQLANEGTEGNEIDGTTGNWTIQEGEEDLYLLNRKNGKKYKFNLTEIE